MKMFEFDDNIEFQRIKESNSRQHYWDPLTPEDVWPPFVFCMMTVINENSNSQKYNHIVFVEFCEFIPRVALRYHEVKKQ